MLNEHSIVKLSKNILKRYETSIENGVLFLFDVETKEIWTGNSSSNELIKLLDGVKTLKDIYQSLHESFFSNYDYSEVKNSFDSIINSLYNKNFLEFIKE